MSTEGRKKTDPRSYVKDKGDTRNYENSNFMGNPKWKLSV